jgi:hypothetical protein
MKLSAKLFSNRKAIELSINFIIVLSFSILILVMGIYLFTQVLGQGQDLTEKVTSETRGEITDLLDRSPNSPVAIPRVVQVVETGEVAHFPLGIRVDTSRCQETSEAQFLISTNFDVLSSPEDEITEASALSQELKVQIKDWHLEPRTLTLKNNVKDVVDIPIKAGFGAKPGFTYGFDVTVLCNGISYDDFSHKIFLKVR